MEVKTLLQSQTFKRLPPFIRDHRVWEQIKTIKKPFPEMGLSNSLERCSVDFDGKPAYIGFTSTGIQGVWDLATMSMRGVLSCMHWDRPHHRHLIGSVTDPFLGIVYITDNTLTPYGVRFTRRALVRLTYEDSRAKYALLIERPYMDTGNKDPSQYLNRDPHYIHTLGVFTNFLAAKTNNTYSILNSNNCYGYIPRPASTSYLNGYNSMSDCGISYVGTNEPFAAKFANQN